MKLGISKKGGTLVQEDGARFPDAAHTITDSEAEVEIEQELDDGTQEFDDTAFVQLQGEVDISSYIRWVRIFVLQFLGKRQLERQCDRLARTKTPISISLLSVKRLFYRIPGWDSFENVIRSTIEDSSNQLSFNLKVEDVLSALRRQVQHTVVPGRANKFIRHFQKSIERRKEETIFHLGMHCEAVLAALLKNYDVQDPNNERNEDVDSVCKVL